MLFLFLGCLMQKVSIYYFPRAEFSSYVWIAIVSKPKLFTYFLLLYLHHCNIFLLHPLTMFLFKQIFREGTFICQKRCGIIWVRSWWAFSSLQMRLVFWWCGNGWMYPRWHPLDVFPFDFGVVLSICLLLKQVMIRMNLFFWAVNAL